MSEDEAVNIGPTVGAEDTESRAFSGTHTEGEPAVPCPPQSAPDGAVLCKRCRHSNPAGLDRCEKCRSTLKGNKLAGTNYLRAVDLPSELRHLRDEVALFEGGCLVDEADSDVPTRRRALIAYRARIHRRICQLDDSLELRGLIDRRGRLRAAWLTQLQGLVNTAKALDGLLGLERRARRVPSLTEVMNCGK